MIAGISRAALASATALLCSITAGETQMPTSALPKGLAGCYALAIGEWMLPSGHWVPDSIVPRIVTLDTLPANGPGWRLTPGVGDSEQDASASAARWHIRGDTVELVWSSGRRPTRVKLRRLDGGALSGYAIAERDTAVPRRPSANAEARRIACETGSPRRLATPDTAHLVGDRLVIEPLGVSFQLPPLWLGVPRSVNRSYRTCSDDPVGTLEERIHTNRRMLPILTHARGEWVEEYSAVVDSILPFDALVAQAGGGRWIHGHCFMPVQLRFYVGNFSPEWLESSVRTTGVRVASRFFKPVHQTETQAAGWRGIRLNWRAWYYDYGGSAYVELLVRRVHGRTLALVFMYVGGTEEQLAERSLVLRSFDVRP